MADTLKFIKEIMKSDVQFVSDEQGLRPKDSEVFESAKTCLALGRICEKQLLRKLVSPFGGSARNKITSALSSVGSLN